MKKSAVKYYWLLAFCLTPFVVIDNAQPETDMCLRLFDYRTPDGEPVSSWRMVNDNVMGGRSTGQFSVAENSLIFSGFINTNGGGFSSMRHPVTPRSFEGANHIRLSVKSDGRPYTLTLADEVSKQQGVSYRAQLEVGAGSEFLETRLSLSDLKPMFRGRMIQAPELDTSRIQELGIMLSDTVDGEFTLEVAWIDICR